MLTLRFNGYSLEWHCLLSLMGKHVETVSMTHVCQTDILHTSNNETSCFFHHCSLVLKAQADSWGSLFPTVTFFGWSASPTVTIPWHAAPHPGHGWSYRISRECPHPDSCRGLWLMPLSVPVLLVSTHRSSLSLSPPLYPLIGEFWQVATASSCHLSVCLPLMSKQGDMRIYYDGQMVQRAKEKSVSYDLSLLSLLFPACCLICSARPVLVPV